MKIFGRCLKSNKFNEQNIAISIANTNVSIPSCETPYVFWSGQTPVTLGEVIKTMTLPQGTTKNSTGGNAPLYSSN